MKGIHEIKIRRHNRALRLLWRRQRPLSALRHQPRLPPLPPSLLDLKFFFEKTVSPPGYTQRVLHGGVT